MKGMSSARTYPKSPNTFSASCKSVWTPALLSIWWVYIPMEQSSWSAGTVANTRVVASCQNRHPAGADPWYAVTPSGTTSVKEIATGGWVNCRALVKVREIESNGVMVSWYRIRTGPHADAWRLERRSHRQFGFPATMRQHAGCAN